MKTIAFATAAALLGGLSLSVSTPAAAQTFPVVNVTEGAGGIVTTVPGSVPALTVASDGEAPFDPFGAGYDTSDGIQLNGSWVADNSLGGFNKGGWVQLPGTSTWVLPACNAGGCENEPKWEPVGKWYFPGAVWGQPGDASLRIWSADGKLSDFILMANDGPGGSAALTFYSDPSVPEPATWAMLILGLGAVGFAMRQRKAVTA